MGFGEVCIREKARNVSLPYFFLFLCSFYIWGIKFSSVATLFFSANQEMKIGKVCIRGEML